VPAAIVYVFDGIKGFKLDVAATTTAGTSVAPTVR
jgi:hypothetical protein